MAAAVAGPAPAPEIRFARKLADNDKAVRDRGVKKLKAFLRKQSNLSELDCCKLWRGLFYCMWMSDKPLVQEDLAEQLAGLVRLFPDANTAIVFLRAFFIIMAREWTKIDRHRIDKFYLLVRRVLHQGFELLRAHEWDMELAKAVADDVARVPLSRASDNPNGLKWFVIEKYVAALKESAEVTPCPPAVLATLLDPLLLALAHDADKTTRRKVCEAAFAESEMASVPGLPWGPLAARCFELAADKAIAPPNRADLYALRKAWVAHEAVVESEVAGAPQAGLAKKAKAQPKTVKATVADAGKGKDAEPHAQTPDKAAKKRRAEVTPTESARAKKSKVASTPEVNAQPPKHPATEAKKHHPMAAAAVPMSEPPKPKPRVQIVLSNNKISQFNKFHRVALPDSPRAFDPQKKPAAGVLRMPSASTPLHTARASKT